MILSIFEETLVCKHPFRYIRVYLWPFSFCASFLTATYAIKASMGLQTDLLSILLEDGFLRSTLEMPAHRAE